MLHEDELQVGYFQQNRARIHTTAENIVFSSEYLEGVISSLSARTILPPRFCDLTPRDFFLWLYIKNSIFAAFVLDLNDLLTNDHE